MEMALRVVRREEVVYTRAGVADGVVARLWLFCGLQCIGSSGEGVRDEEGVAVDFGKVAAFDVFLETKCGYDGGGGGGIGGMRAGDVGWGQFRGGVGVEDILAMDGGARSGASLDNFDVSLGVVLGRCLL
jgi:hypothetical protein